MMDNAPVEARPLEWQCTRLNNHQLSPYDPNDFDRVNFCVHVDVAPTCPLNTNIRNGEIAEVKPIVNPVLTKEDGGVYEKNNLNSYYTKPYSYYLSADSPTVPQNELTYVIYQQQNRWKVLITHQLDRYEVVLLPIDFCQAPQIANFLSQQQQNIQRNNQKMSDTLNFPKQMIRLIANMCQQPHEVRLLSRAFSTLTEDYFSPGNQRSIRFSYSAKLRSKVDPRKSIGGSNKRAALVGIFRSELCVQNTLLMIEKKDAHQCGYLKTYVFKPDKEPNEKITLGINKTTFCNAQYASLTQADLLRRHGISTKQAETSARTFVITNDQLSRLEQAIGKSEKKIAAGELRYRYRSGKAAFNLMDWFVSLMAPFIARSAPTEYMNEASWCLAMLTESGVYNGTPVFDQNYEITPAEYQPWTVSFFGATPERLLQNPAQHQPNY